MNNIEKLYKDIEDGLKTSMQTVAAGSISKVKLKSILSPLVEEIADYIGIELASHVSLAKQNFTEEQLSLFKKGIFNKISDGIISQLSHPDGISLGYEVQNIFKNLFESKVFEDNLSLLVKDIIQAHGVQEGILSFSDTEKEDIANKIKLSFKGKLIDFITSRKCEMYDNLITQTMNTEMKIHLKSLLGDILSRATDEFDLSDEEKIILSERIQNKIREKIKEYRPEIQLPEDFMSEEILSTLNARIHTLGSSAVQSISNDSITEYIKDGIGLAIKDSIVNIATNSINGLHHSLPLEFKNNLSSKIEVLLLNMFAEDSDLKESFNAAMSGFVKGNEGLIKTIKENTIHATAIVKNNMDDIVISKYQEAFGDAVKDAVSNKIPYTLIQEKVEESILKSVEDKSKSIMIDNPLIHKKINELYQKSLSDIDWYSASIVKDNILKIFSTQLSNEIDPSVFTDLSSHIEKNIIDNMDKFHVDFSLSSDFIIQEIFKSSTKGARIDTDKIVERMEETLLSRISTMSDENIIKVLSLLPSKSAQESIEVLEKKVKTMQNTISRISPVGEGDFRLSDDLNILFEEDN